MPKRVTAKQRVNGSRTMLQAMNAKELLAWAKANEMDSRSGFSAFKKALAEIGVDYDALRDEAKAAHNAALASLATHSVTLFSDAKASKDRFGICGPDGKPIWYGKFFPDDRDYVGEQSSGEMAVAKKAVWLASKIKDSIGAPAINLTLKVDAEWLTWANTVRAVEDGGGKARELGEMALRYGVVLTVEHIPGAENPADKFTVCDGYQKWQSANLTALATAL